MGKNIPPLATIAGGMEALKGLILKSGKVPRPGGRLYVLLFSGSRTVLMKEIVSSVLSRPTCTFDDETSLKAESSSKSGFNLA